MSATGSYPSRRRRRGVRLTRRGRIVVVALILAVLLGAFWGTRQAIAVAAAGEDDSRLRTATVRPGGTLWEVAVTAEPEVDPRVTVRRIMDLNGLSSPIVAPGERLVLPPPE